MLGQTSRISICMDPTLGVRLEPLPLGPLRAPTFYDNSVSGYML